MQPRTRAIVSAALVAAGLGAALAGCSDIYFDRRDTVSPGAGDALASNKVTHMVDPWPRYVGNRSIAFNGERMQSAAERYRRHEVIRPIPESTNNQDSQRVPPPITTEHIPIASPATTAPPPVNNTVK